MKKYIFLAVTILFGLIICGCDRTKEKNVLEDFTKKIEKLDAYYIEGELEIINNEESYLYSVDVAYAKENNFKVSLKNKVNNHEQILLRNTDGVYVKTQESTKQKLNVI